MATTEPQTLTAYTQTALKSLEETTDPSALSRLTKELYVQAREYPTLRQIFKQDEVRRAVGEALVKQDAEGLKTVLVGIFTNVEQEKRPKQAEEVPGPDPFTTEESYASVIRLGSDDRVARLKEVGETSQTYLAQKKSAVRRQFAQQLTNNFISRSRIHITEAQKIQEEKRIEQALSLKTNIKTVIEQSPLKKIVSGRDLRRITSDSERAAQKINAAQERVEQVMTAAVSSIAADEDAVYKPKVFLEIAANQAERSNAPVAQIISRAATLERATEGFVGNKEELPQNLTLLANNPLQKMAAWAVNRLPEGPRGAIIAGVVGGAWEKAIDTATRYYGQQIVNENWFQRALAHGNQGLSNKKNALQSITNGGQKVLADVAVALFRGEMDEATIAYVENIRQHTALPTMASAIFRKPAGETVAAPTERGRPVTGAVTEGAAFRGPTTVAPTETRRPVAAAGIAGQVLRGPAGEMVVTQTETVRQYIMTMGPVSYQQFYAAAVYGHNPGLLSYGLNLGFRYATKKAIKAGVKKGVEKAVISTATKGTLEAILGLGTGGIGTLVAIAVDLGWSFLKGLFNKGVSLFKSLVGMGTSRNPEDSLLIVGAVGVALVFFLPLFPLFNIPAFNQSMIDASLATSLFVETGGPSGETGEEEAFSAGTNPGAPIGSTTSSCANVSGVLLKQCDPQWGSVSFGTSPGCTICSGGCGPTSTTMILRAFGSNASVVDVANKVAALDNGSFCASSPQSNLRILQDAGLSTSAIGAGDWHEADEVLKNCGLIFALTRTPTGGGHYLVITGLNWDISGTSVVSYNVLDPYYSSTTHSPSEFGIRAMYGVVK